MPASRSVLSGNFQLFDFRQLTCRHLLHQLQNCLLLDFANLNELHDANSIRCWIGDHPPWVAWHYHI